MSHTLIESAEKGDFRTFSKLCKEQLGKLAVEAVEQRRQALLASLNGEQMEEAEEVENALSFDVSNVENIEESLRSMAILGVTGELIEDENRLQVEDTEDNKELMEYWCKRFGATQIEESEDSE